MYYLLLTWAVGMGLIRLRLSVGELLTMVVYLAAICVAARYVFSERVFAKWNIWLRFGKSKWAQFALDQPAYSCGLKAYRATTYVFSFLSFIGGALILPVHGFILAGSVVFLSWATWPATYWLCMRRNCVENGERAVPKTVP